MTSGAPRGPTNVRVDGSLLQPLTPAVSVFGLSQPEGDVPKLSVSLTVRLAFAHSAPVHVSYVTVDDSARAEIDFTAASGQLLFVPGQTQKSITIDYDGNLVSEGDKSFLVALGGVDGETLPRFATGGSLATVTLTDDDGPIGFFATGGVEFEGDSGTTNLNFRLFLDRAPKAGEVVSIDYEARSDGQGATDGVDYMATSGTQVFAVGETRATVTVPVVGDTDDEALEIFTMHFENPEGIVLHTSEVTGQVIDDDFDAGGLGSQRVVAYIDGTSGGLNLPSANRVTHIMYAFANLNVDGSLSIGGPGPGAAVDLKSQNPNLKVLVSIGGWTWSANFSAVAADPAKRAAFTASCRALIVNNGLDGIDLDWEWPGVPGGPGTAPTPQDGANYTLLVVALRSELDDLEASDGQGKHYEISAFTAAGSGGIAQLQLEQLAPHFDFLTAQGYDLHGSWDFITGHNAGLFDNSADLGDDRLNIEAVLAQYLAGGFPPSKLLVGAPFYARGFSAVGDTNNGAFQSHSGGGTTTLYRDLTNKIATTPRFWDDSAKVPFLYNRTTAEWTSYDDPQAMREKALYSLRHGFGGVYFWRSGGDTDDRQLLATISDTLAAPDADADGLTDAWERGYFGDLASASGSGDPDRDGETNREEEAAGTDPLDPFDYLHLGTVVQDGENLLLELPTRIGLRYQLQVSTNLTDWSLSGSPIEGTGATIQLSVPGSSSRLFVRAMIVE